MKNYTVWCADIYLSLRLSKTHADLLSDTLVSADLWGHSSHGVLRTSWYGKRLMTGTMTAFGGAENLIGKTHKAGQPRQIWRHLLIAHTNSIESVWALLKRGIYGTYHHVSKKHLHRYVNEASLRLNEGSVKKHISGRISVICGGVTEIRLSYNNLTSGGHA